MTARPLDAARDALIVLQGQVIAALAAENARLAERAGDLERRLEALERLASRNSGNSSSSTSNQAWFFTNAQSEAGGPAGADGTAFEVELYGTSSPECINYVGGATVLRAHCQ